MTAGRGLELMSFSRGRCLCCSGHSLSLGRGSRQRVPRCLGRKTRAKQVLILGSCLERIVLFEPGADAVAIHGLASRPRLGASVYVGARSDAVCIPGLDPWPRPRAYVYFEASADAANSGKGSMILGLAAEKSCRLHIHYVSSSSKYCSFNFRIVHFL